MKAKVLWTPEAQQDRIAIWEHLAAENPPAAVKMDERFSEAAALVSRHPQIGKPGKIPGTRELIPHESYRFVYEIHDGIAWVLALIHTARRWPPIR